ncbi:unnamed protein product [Protopolystoma xenopodis]|uniref:Cadherin domain-containing protein n=1 Tax=Protopolystoma xenopodis TaxID=117903 RepID=A0A3S5ABE1_9PLAT|nr:unnamed protein product [Protopolystoma xenopodis]
MDINDNAPIWLFPRSPDDTLVKMKFDIPANSIVTRIQAIDLDTGENAQIIYSVVNIALIDQTSNQTNNPQQTKSIKSGSSVTTVNSILIANKEESPGFQSEYSELFKLDSRSGLIMRSNVNSFDESKKTDLLVPGKSLRVVLRATDKGYPVAQWSQEVLYIDLIAGSEFTSNLPYQISKSDLNINKEAEMLLR